MVAASAARTDCATKYAEFALTYAHGCRILLVRRTWLPPRHPYADLDRRETCNARVCHPADLQALSITDTLFMDPATKSADPRLANHLACSELIERLTLLIVKSTRNRRKGGLALVAKFHPVITGTVLGKRFPTVFHENTPINGTGNVIETALPVRPSEPKRHAVYGWPHERPLRAAMAFGTPNASAKQRWRDGDHQRHPTTVRRRWRCSSSTAPKRGCVGRHQTRTCRD